MTVELRVATLVDVDAVVAFGAAVVPEHYAPILGERAARAQLTWWTRERIAPAVEAGRLHLAITDAGDVVGVCQTGELAGDQVIWKLYLAPEFRGCSLGVSLLHLAISKPPAHTRQVDVEHFAGNVGAARFYEREGFEVIRTDPAPACDSPDASVVWRRLQLT